MNYKEIKAAYMANQFYFHAALGVLHEHGADKLMCNDVQAQFVPANTNLITPEAQREILAIANKLASADLNTLLYFVQRDMAALPLPDGAAPVHPSGDEEGVCPLCGGSVNYQGENTIDDDGGVIPWECPECGATGKEGYNRAFDQHYAVCDRNGVPIPGRPN